jgi:hypothetical protein
MDFGEMTDALKDQVSDKVQEGLTRKLDEIKTDVTARFGDLAGLPGEKAIPLSPSAQPTVNASEAESGTPAENESEVDETADEQTPIAEAGTEANQDDGDAGKDEAA